MIVASTLAVIFGYLLTPVIGFLIAVAVILGTLSKRSLSSIEKQLHLILMTVPLYMTPILPGLPHVFSWTTLFLFTISVSSLRGKHRSHPFEAYSAIVLFAFSVATSLLVTGGFAGIYYLLQIVLFVFPIYLAYKNRSFLSSELGPGADVRLIKTLSSVIAAASIGVLAQWLLHTRAGISLGHITIFSSREIYDLTIPAFSVLSAVLSIGIVLGPMLWRREAKVAAILLPLLASAAILVNSSRTGILAGAAVLILSILFPPRGAHHVATRFAIIPVAFFLWFLYQAAISSSRFVDETSLIDDNGRLDNLDLSMDYFSANLQNILIGVGYGDFGGPSPHNFAVETLVRSGIITTAILFLWIAAMLYLLQGSDWFFVVFSLLIGSMFFSGFYAVKAFTAICILAVVLHSFESRAKVSQSDSQDASNQGSRSARKLYS